MMERGVRETNNERAVNAREGKRRLGGSLEISLSFLHVKGYCPLPDGGDGSMTELPEGGGASHASMFTVWEGSSYETALIRHKTWDVTKSANI